MIGMIDEDSEVYWSEEDIKSYFYHKFKERFISEEMAPTSFGEWSGFFKSCNDP